MIHVTAFKFRWDPTIYSWDDGHELKDFEGFAKVYFLDGAMIFKTGINKDGERFWQAIGNNPALPARYGAAEYPELREV